MLMFDSFFLSICSSVHHISLKQISWKVCTISHGIVNLRKPLNLAKFGLSKIFPKSKNKLENLTFSVKVTTVQMYHCVKFESDHGWKMCNISHVRLREHLNMAKFQLSKNLPKIEKKSNRPDFWCEGNYTIDKSLCQVWSKSIERCAKFPM